MQSTPATPDWGVAHRLHTRLRHTAPGSFEEQSLERALTLLAHSDRPDASDIAREVCLLQNGRFTHHRSRKREALNIQKYTQSRTLSEWTQIQTPESFFFAKFEAMQCGALLDALRVRIAQNGANLGRTLEGMLRGETALQTAQACHCSTRTITTYRSHIRQIAVEVFLQQGVVLAVAPKGDA